MSLWRWGAYKGADWFYPSLLYCANLSLCETGRADFETTKPWIGGAIFAALVFSWVYLAIIYGGKEYTHQILFKQNVGRFASSFAHKRPFYYFFINFPLNFMPWSLFIRALQFYAFSRKGREKRPHILLPVVWFAVIFIFFSITSGKRDIYVLPLYPAASLLTAWFLNELREHAQGS